MQLPNLLAALAAAMVTEQAYAQNADSLSGEVQAIGGVSNNVANPMWGNPFTDLLRLAPAAYADGVDAPSLPNDLSARAISDLINNQADSNDPSQDIQTVDRNSMSDFGYSFGQFMDHDLDLTVDNGVSFPILVAVTDPIGGTDGTPLAFLRTIPDPLTGTSASNPAQDFNTISSYFDLSQIYGSDIPTAEALRTFAAGLMKTSPGGLPPLCNSDYFTADQLTALNASVGGMANNGGAPNTALFATGDSRGNENIELTALQTLFLDNHNLIAGQLLQQNPNWTDEELYEEARKVNIAEYQNIIYTEWIPAALGQNALQKYAGYNANVNAAIANEFSTVAFRFGHSLLSGNVERQGNDGLPVAASVPLAEDFFDPYILNGEGQSGSTDPFTGLPTTTIGAILKGNADGNCQAMDLMAINAVRDLLFNEVIPGVGAGQDLMALDVQRGRDHGMPDYNTLRVNLGLRAVTKFAQITRNVTIQHELEEAYPGGVDTIDAFEGGLAEDHVSGSDVGPLFQAIMVNQFERLRDGDRFFYLNEDFTALEKQIFESENSLANVIAANTEITNLQSNVMVFKASISGTVSVQGGKVSEITVELEDTSRDVLATTQTDGQDRYSFNQLSGPSTNPLNAPGVSATGYYVVALKVPSGFKLISTAPAPVLISRGDTDVKGVDFTIESTRGSNPPTMPGRNMTRGIRF